MTCATASPASSDMDTVRGVAVKKPIKSLVRMCRLIARVGRWMRKIDLTIPAPAINVSACSEEVLPAVVCLPAEPVPVSTTSRYLCIPAHVDCSQMDTGSLASPTSPKGPASYPPTPDYVKFPTSKWQQTASLNDAFFPHEDEVELQRGDDGDVRDWAVDYTDLEVKGKIQQNATGDIHRGQWHGNVLIYKHTDEDSTDQFMTDVAKQSKIRHENVLLFLGAAVDNEEQLAIVLQPPKQQQSLHQLLNSPRRLNKLPHNLKWNMALQMAQAVSYLHAKDVCVGPALHSGNVFLEAKIKLSLLDFGFGGPADVMFPRFSSCPSRNYLTSFLAPEILPLFNVNSRLKATFTEATDSFAFGSLLYEIFTEQKPFKSLPLAAHLDVLSSEDHTELLDRSDIPSSIQKIIAQCWKLNPADRPTFSQILESLNKKPFLLSRHSSSQPDLFDVAGTTRSKSFSQL